MKLNRKSGGFSTRYGANQLQRKQQGSSILELPILLYIVFVVLLMPLLDLATITLKAALVNSAVQDGVHAAAKAKTFQSGTPDKPAAISLAIETIKTSASKFSGLNVFSVDTRIVITPVTGGAPVRTPVQLTTPADTSRFIYQIETTAGVKVDPLFHLNPSIVGNIPGVSTPLIVSYAGRQMAENPQGLNK